MAITQTYVDYGAGNDYNGASFTDGAYTSATKVLAKNGAFTKTKVNHWLYLSSNAGGSIVAGYYKVATATDANSIILATDAGGGVDATDVKCTQADGTALLPFRSVQGALDIITRDATNGDQINIKSSTAQTLAASLVLTTYGTPAGGKPLILRGYTSAANDGGRGAISGAGAYTIWASSTLDFITCVDIDFSHAGNNHLYYVRDWSTLINCTFDKGASSPSSKYLCIVNSNSQVIHCQFTNAGTSGNALTATSSSLILNCYATAQVVVTGATAIGNVVNLAEIGATGLIVNGQPSYAIGNTVYQSQAGTGTGINLGSQLNVVCINNVITGFSGTGGKGISKTGDAACIGYNAFYNCATPESYTGDIWDDLGGDQALGALPFTNAAGADFSVSTALKALGYPASFLGASTNTYIDIGAAQRQEPAGGAVSISPSLGSVGAA